MNKEEDYIELINRYLEGDMSSVEANDFRVRLEAEPVLKSEYNLYVSLNQLVIDHELLNVKNELGEIHKKQTESNRKNPGKLGIISLLILVTGLALYWNFRLDEKPGRQKNDPISRPALAAQVGNKETVKTMAGSKPLRNIDTLEAKQQVYALSKSEPNKVPKVTQSASSDNLIKVESNETLKKTDSTLIQSYDTLENFSPIQNYEPVHNKIEQEKEISKRCDNVTISFETQVINACLPEKNGQIVIEGIQGGQTPYQVYFENKETSNFKIENLGKGNYHITVSDGRGCVQSSEVKVNEEFCQKDFEINPNFGQAVIFPEYYKKGNLSIYDRGGKVMFKAVIDEYSTYTWNGQLKNGETIPGYYVFLIQYEDGKLFQGSITITQ